MGNCPAGAGGNLKAGAADRIGFGRVARQPAFFEAAEKLLEAFGVAVMQNGGACGRPGEGFEEIQGMLGPEILFERAVAVGVELVKVVVFGKDARVAEKAGVFAHEGCDVAAGKAGVAEFVA